MFQSLSVGKPHNLFCQIFEYVFNIMFSFYSWVNVVTSTDRLFSVIKPYDFKIRKNIKFQASVIAIVFVILTAINVPNYLYYRNSNFTICWIPDRITVINVYFGNLIVADFVPFSIIIVNNIVITYEIVVRKRRLVGRRIQLRREIQFVKTLFAMDSWFLVYHVPFSVFDVIEAVYELETQPYWQIVHNVTVMLIIVQITCNVFVYLASNKLFRKHFFLMFCSCCKH